MPQDCTAGIELKPFAAEGTKRAEQKDSNKGSLSARGSTTAIQRQPTGSTGILVALFGPKTSERREHRLENQHWARLPITITSKIFAYIGDPFDRATLSMTCRVLNQRLISYRSEFALFRHVIATKRRLDVRTQASCVREFSLWADIFSGNAWTHWRASGALRNIIVKLRALYPHVPERIFHELWPLFLNLDSKSATQLVEDVAQEAMKRSPHLAVIVLTEFAKRTLYSDRIGPEFHDKLLDLAIPLWQDPETTVEAESLIGAIAQRMEVCSDNESVKRRDEARWKRMVELLPPSTRLDSPAVLGLARTAYDIHYHWERRGKQPGIAFPAKTILSDRLGGLPAYAQIKAHTLHARTPAEAAIEERRAARYVHSGRFARDCAEDEARRRQFAGHFSSSMPRVQTAGGG